jgi:Na+/H+ antiporter NhaA
MSTDTAFALGVLAIVGARSADRLRVFLLTVVVVDDIVALLVISIVYTEDVAVRPLVIAAALFAVLLVVRLLRVRTGLVYALLGAAVWLSMVESGVDPLIVGLAIGLLAYAYPAGREDLERAMQEFREFREQPTPELARRARVSLESAVSPNERLALLWHPWVSYLVVPLFALANAGVPLRWSVLQNAYSSRLTLAIVLAYVLGKPLGILTASFAATVSSRGRLRPPVGFGSVLGAGAAAGVGFTVTLLIAALAFDRGQLQQAKVGVITAAVAATLLSWVTFRVLDLLPPKLRTRALLGTSTAIVDLADPVDPERDHIRGPDQSDVTLLEYGDLECPYCGRAEPVVRELLRSFAEIRYVWRHLPLDDVHPHARLAAEATEAAAVQGRFWEMHDLLLEHQDTLRFADLISYAGQLGLDVKQFAAAVKERRHADRVAADVDSAALSGVTGTPTFFVNGRRHHGAFDLESLKTAVEAAGARATLSR